MDGLVYCRRRITLLNFSGTTYSGETWELLTVLGLLTKANQNTQVVTYILCSLREYKQDLSQVAVERLHVALGLQWTH